MPADGAEPESNVAVTMGQYVIEVTEGEVTAGPQVAKVEHIGAQPHFIFWAKVPDGLTED